MRHTLKFAFAQGWFCAGRLFVVVVMVWIIWREAIVVLPKFFLTHLGDQGYDYLLPIMSDLCVCMLHISLPHDVLL
jgi:hypothetical protein